MAKRVVLVRHGEEPPDDRVHTYLVQNGFSVEQRWPFQGDVLGEPDQDLAGTVLYGGPFNVFEQDRHTFLKEEERWIEACLKAEVPMHRPMS